MWRSGVGRIAQRALASVSSHHDSPSRFPLVRWDISSEEYPSSDATATARTNCAGLRLSPGGHLRARRLWRGRTGRPRAVAANVDGTERVIQWAGRGRESPPRVLFVSSSHVYAPVGRDSPALDERAPLSPATAYGRTKLAAERRSVRALDESGADIVIARAFQHAGPRQNGRMMLAEWCRQLATGRDEPVRVRTRDAIIDLCDVRDVVRAYRLLALRGHSGVAYNVGSGQMRTSGEVLDTLIRKVASNRQVIETAPGPIQNPVANIARLVELTGWRAEIPLERTVADTLAFWRSHAGASL